MKSISDQTQPNKKQASAPVGRENGNEQELQKFTDRFSISIDFEKYSLLVWTPCSLVEF
jgi:hypothetical protein